jgi:hypothetical protein
MGSGLRTRMPLLLLLLPLLPPPLLLLLWMALWRALRILHLQRPPKLWSPPCFRPPFLFCLLQPQLLKTSRTSMMKPCWRT